MGNETLEWYPVAPWILPFVQLGRVPIPLPSAMVMVMDF